MAMKIIYTSKGLVFLLAISMMTLLASCTDTSQRPKDLNTLIGKDKEYVLKVMGEPDAKGKYDTTILDPRKHTQAEIDQWWESTPQSSLDYGDVRIQFNVHNKVIAVKPKPVDIDQRPKDLNTLVGRDRNYVMNVMGEPDAEKRYDTKMLDPKKHTRAEIDKWRESTPSYGFFYGDTLIQFNKRDEVIAVKPKP